MYATSHDGGSLAAARLLLLPVFALLVTGACDNGKKDKVAPEITAAVTPDANSDGWHMSDATVTFHCTDEQSGIQSCTDPTVVSTEGEDQPVPGLAVDKAGNSATTLVRISLDKTPPILENFRPANGSILPDPELNLVGDIADSLSGVSSVTCSGNGTTDEAEITESDFDETIVFSCSLPLDPGTHIITVVGRDIAANETTSLLTYTYTPPPVISIASPAEGDLITGSPAAVTGSVDDTSAQVSVNGVAATVAGNSFSAAVPVTNGSNAIVATAQNIAGTGTDRVNVLAIAGLAPTVEIQSPANGFVLGAHESDAPYTVTVRGWVRDNRIPAGVGAPQVQVWFGPDAVQPTLVRRASGLCRPATRCWAFEASHSYIANRLGFNISISVDATTGSQSTTASITGILDSCLRNNSLSSGPACDASFYQRTASPRQSRRCMQAADGCSNPVMPNRKDDPTGGIWGRTSTAFGKPEVTTDEHGMEGSYTVFGQERPNKLPCNRHDECYHQWCPVAGATKTGSVAEKLRCNERFRDDMLAVCRSAYPETTCPADRIGVVNCPAWRSEKNSCFSWAYIYFEAVDADAKRYLLNDAYDGYPYRGYFTTCESCPVVE